MQFAFTEEQELLRREARDAALGGLPKPGGTADSEIDGDEARAPPEQHQDGEHRRALVDALFPEGGVVKGPATVCRGGPIKKGACVIAQRAGVPIIPCVVLGTHRLNHPLRRVNAKTEMSRPTTRPTRMSGASRGRASSEVRSLTSRATDASSGWVKRSRSPSDFASSQLLGSL